MSQRVDRSGGRISIPETGFTMDIPAGALSLPLTITVTADEKYVAYKMEPTGTQFKKDVTITQSLRTTTIAGQPLRTSIFAAYISDDNVKLSGKVPVLEIEPSTTIFSPLNARLPKGYLLHDLLPIAAVVGGSQRQELIESHAQ